MIVIWKDTTLKLHGKRHKSDRYYFRVHYGKQRLVHLYKEYVDKPTEAQKTAREQFTELRREVARQLKDPVLRAKWEKEFKADNQGYKMLHCYVYAMLKKAPSNSPRKGEDCTSSEGAHAGNADNANFASWAQNNAEPVRGQRMKATSLSSEGAHADNADNANLQREHKISQMNAHILPCGKCCADNAENVRGQRMKAISPADEKMPMGVHVVVMGKDGEIRRIEVRKTAVRARTRCRSDELRRRMCENLVE